MEPVYNTTTEKMKVTSRRTAFYNSSFWDYAFPFIVGPLTALDFCCSMIISGNIHSDLPGVPLPSLSMPITALVTMGMLTACTLIFNRLDNVVKHETVLGCIILTALTVVVDAAYFITGLVHYYLGIAPDGFVFLQVNICASVLRCLLIARAYNYVYNVEGTNHPICLTSGGAIAGASLSAVSLLATSFWGTLMYVNGATALLRIVCIAGLVVKYMQVVEAYSDPFTLQMLYAEANMEYKDPFTLCKGDHEDLESSGCEAGNAKIRYYDPQSDFKAVLPIILAVFILSVVSYCMYPQVIYDVIPTEMSRPTFAALASFIAPNFGHLVGAVFSTMIPIYASRSACFPIMAFARGGAFVVFVLISNYIPELERHAFPLLITNDWAFISGVFLLFVISGCMLMMAFNGLYDKPRRYNVYVVSVINLGMVLGITASTVFYYAV